ncbi:hypothetical protein [Vulcanococcus sp.]|jgi:hypothetical protein|uniref:hypothetical protein n=1 Tax=Vulcanococcus sp. TaxID=2856995 RepID=UPI0032327F9C
MEPHWLKLRWPLTVLALGGMVSGLLLRSSSHPIQLRLQLSFQEPLRLSGSMQHQLTMKDPVLVKATGPLRMDMVHAEPIRVIAKNPDPVQVQMSNTKPIQVQVGEQKPMEVDVQPKGSMKVRIGL